MGSLALEQVAQRLDVSLGLLTGGGRTVESRHRTLRATLDWSHQLLSEPEKVLFGRLSVFAGGRGGSLTVEDAGAYQAVRRGEARRHGGDGGASPAARRDILRRLRRGGRTRAFRGGSGPLGAATRGRAREHAEGDLVVPG